MANQEGTNSALQAEATKLRAWHVAAVLCWWTKRGREVVFAGVWHPSNVGLGYGSGCRSSIVRNNVMDMMMIKSTGSMDGARHNRHVM